MTDDDMINQALNILETRLYKPEQNLSSSRDTKNYLTLKYAEKESESFNVLYLDNKHRLIALKEMFQGTINTAAVYPREIVKATLAFNASAVILSHNHPSGCAEPSGSDRELTQQLSKALKLIDVKVLDHIVVGGMDTYSFAEHGIL
ncbi:RadC family protein [Agarilytica rhodophyticola]|uniref:RadC family protein n=1 Tax=Agarilytica rhodophyticola TaxID=1737490 RepID=UPI000B34180B|nr:DNA repair protein RadC [Agarilytica rhodophyticola]